MKVLKKFGDQEVEVLRLISLLGGRGAAREAFGVSNQTLTNWLKFGMPAERAVEGERLTGGLMRSEDLIRKKAA